MEGTQERANYRSFPRICVYFHGLTNIQRAFPVPTRLPQTFYPLFAEGPTPDGNFGKQLGGGAQFPRRFVDKYMLLVFHSSIFSLATSAFKLRAVPKLKKFARGVAVVSLRSPLFHHFLSLFRQNISRTLPILAKPLRSMS